MVDLDASIVFAAPGKENAPRHRDGGAARVSLTRWLDYGIQRVQIWRRNFGGSTSVTWTTEALGIGRPAAASQEVTRGFSSPRNRPKIDLPAAIRGTLNAERASRNIRQPP